MCGSMGAAMSKEQKAKTQYVDHYTPCTCGSQRTNGSVCWANCARTIAKGNRDGIEATIESEATNE